MCEEVAKVGFNPGEHHFLENIQIQMRKVDGEEAVTIVFYAGPVQWPFDKLLEIKKIKYITIWDHVCVTEFDKTSYQDWMIFCCLPCIMCPISYTGKFNFFFQMYSVPKILALYFLFV